MLIEGVVVEHMIKGLLLKLLLHELVADTVYLLASGAFYELA